MWRNHNKGRHYTKFLQSLASIHKVNNDEKHPEAPADLFGTLDEFDISMDIIENEFEINDNYTV